MKKIFLTIILLISISFLSLCQNWTAKANLPASGRFSGVSFTISGKAYVGLGVDGSGLKFHDMWEYNPVSNSWTQKSNYPGAGLYASTAFSINGKGYVCLGGDVTINSNGQSDLWEYNPVTDTWLQKASFPGTARYGASCFVIGDTAFIGTGSYTNPNDYLTDFWMYIPSSNSWTQLADVPGIHRNHGTAFSIGKFGYLGTGLYDGSTATTDVWKYNKQTNTWSAIPNLPGPGRNGTTSFVINNKGYLGTGMEMNGIYHNEFYEYDPNLNTWVLVPTNGALPPRYASVSFVINGICYDGIGCPDLNDLWSIAFTDFTFQNVCQGGTVSFQTQNIPGTSSFSWNFGDPSSGAANTSNLQNPSHNYSIPGNYTITLISQQALFNDTIQHSVTVNPLPQVDLGNDTVLCSGTNFSLDAGNPGATYLWSSGATTQTIPVTNSGTYMVTVTSSAGCTASDALTTVYNISSHSVIDTSFCLGSSIIFEGQTINSSGQYTFNHTTSLGCDSTITVHATVNDVPSITLPTDVTFCIDEVFNVNLDISGSWNAVLWEDGSSEALRTITENGVYIVDVTGNCGNSQDTISVLFKDCESDIWFPNSFTPNGDYINQVFKAEGYNVFQFHILIYNRWGQLIFEGSKIEKGWYGTLNGKKCPDGIYTWIADYQLYRNNKQVIEKKTGSVLLMR